MKINFKGLVNKDIVQKASWKKVNCKNESIDYGFINIDNIPVWP